MPITIYHGLWDGTLFIQDFDSEEDAHYAFLQDMIIDFKGKIKGFKQFNEKTTLGNTLALQKWYVSTTYEERRKLVEECAEFIREKYNDGYVVGFKTLEQK